MSIGTIILIILVIALLGGFSGIGGGPFYGTGYYGGGGLGLDRRDPADPAAARKALSRTASSCGGQRRACAVPTRYLYDGVRSFAGCATLRVPE